MRYKQSCLTWKGEGVVCFSVVKLAPVKMCNLLKMVKVNHLNLNLV